RLPPPAPVAASFACTDRARARRAADRGEPALVQRMRRYSALARVGPDLVLCPLRERIELHDGAVVVVDLDLADVGARGPLVAAQAGDPRVEGVEMLRQRPHLAHLAAEEPVLDLAVEEIRAVLADHARDVLGVRREDLELEARVTVAHLLDQLERLLGQPAGVDREHLHVRVERVRHVDQDGAVDLERRGDRDSRREPLERPLEQRLRLLALELDRELAGLEIVQHLFVQAHAASFFFAGSRPASTPSSSSVDRSQNALNDSSGLLASSQAATRPSTVASSSSVGTRRNTGRALAAPGPMPPRRKTSYAWCRLPFSSRTVVPWKPRSPTQCCAHACGQPSRCRRRPPRSSPNRVSSERISASARVFVSVTE